MLLNLPRHPRVWAVSSVGRVVISHSHTHQRALSIVEVGRLACWWTMQVLYNCSVPAVAESATKHQVVHSLGLAHARPPLTVAKLFSCQGQDGSVQWNLLTSAARITKSKNEIWDANGKTCQCGLGHAMSLATVATSAICVAFSSLCCLSADCIISLSSYSFFVYCDALRPLQPFSGPYQWPIQLSSLLFRQFRQC